MEHLDYVRKYIEVLKGKEEKRVLSALKTLDELSPIDKNAIYTYLFPKPIMDMELPKIIMNGRKTNGGSDRGYLEPNDLETLILLRAYNTRQYKKFILHLLHSFVQDEKGIYVEDSQDEFKCGACGKLLYGFTTWKILCDKNPSFGEQERREYLAYGSSQSSQHICLDCMIQLQNLNKILEAVEGKHYLK